MLPFQLVILFPPAAFKIKSLIPVFLYLFYSVCHKVIIGNITRYYEYEHYFNVSDEDASVLEMTLIFLGNTSMFSVLIIMRASVIVLNSMEVQS